MKALIIDDDPHSHDVLKKLLEQRHPEVKVLASAYSVAEGKNKIVKHQPELVFLDIELGDGLGFDIFSHFDEIFFKVIFITAFDHYAIRAIRFGALDFLVKPISKAELKKALERVKKNIGINPSKKQVSIAKESIENESLPSRIAIANLYDIYYLEIAKIIRLEANKEYTIFYLDEAPGQIVSSKNFGKYVHQFEPYFDFAKIHRKHMLNLNFVKKYSKRHQKVIMMNGEEIDLARPFLESFKEKMGRI